ncbi:uncharacterized protein LOC131290680 [Anopheles ziemanni]|uniref:uncharacterized protein LOC131268941 n=1 Tax=Anopheles coustani TaxID=139045 RepID=UPI0026598159|nr:uncharacterized protein LOC131268941 [Anopheles coustani]XP_058175825.1 uncharacterized protein LOC131290680 [Anopheles ziemanni]
MVLANPIDSPAPVAEVPVTTPAEEVQTSTRGADVASSTEGSKMSRFLDDVTLAFKQGTAKMKESLENAASSVKDGVLQGYDYVRSKLTGTSADGPSESADLNSTVAALTSTVRTDDGSTTSSVAPSTERPATGGSHAGNSLAGYGGAVGVSNEPAKIVPNDEYDEDRIIFNDKDMLAEKSPEGDDERDVTETPAATGVTIDNRFIIASPLTCKSGQEVVNGKCRNVF